MQRNSRWIGDSERFTIRYIVKMCYGWPGRFNAIIRARIRIFLKRKYSDKSRAPGGSTAIYLSDWGYTTSLVNCCTSTTTVTDKRMGKVVGEPYRGKPDVRLCVQLRLVCSAGVSPARVRIKSSVAWMAGRRETEYLKPIDKAIF